MPIDSSPPPPNVSHALDTVPNLVHPQDNELRGAIAEIQNSPSTHRPHLIRTIGLSDLVGSNNLDEARNIGWRFLATATSGRKISVEIDDTSDHNYHALLNQGPFVESTEQVLEYLQNEPLVQQGTYTFSILKIPALYVMALWLHDQSGNSDQLIPLSPHPNTLTSGRLYTVEEFVDALRESARQKLSSNF